MTDFPYLEAGSTYECELSISFNDSESGVMHEDFGTLGGLVEST